MAASRGGWVVVALSAVLAAGGCGGSGNDSGTSASTVSTTAPATSVTSTTATTVGTAAEPTTVAASTGDGSTPKVVSFTITPAVDAPCQDGRVQATMAWKVTPATATVTIKDLGSGFGATSGLGQPVGPYASEASGVPVPAWVECDGKDHNLELDATNGGPRFAGQTASVASKA